MQVILAPFFAHFCDLWVQQGHDEGTCVAGYMGATFYVLIVMLLLHCEQGGGPPAPKRLSEGFPPSTDG